jgi:predicted enzyme related to lactoylglutathione lyase
MLNFDNILLSSGDHKRLVKFYGEVFDKKPDMEEGEYAGFLVGSCFLGIGNHDKVKGKNQNPERILFNFSTKEVKEEFERISKIDGIEVVKEPYQMEGWGGWIATLADPDGNYFQLITPWEDNN